jgi:hypothetical protein
MIFISYHILQTILAGKLQKSFKTTQRQCKMAKTLINYFYPLNYSIYETSCFLIYPFAFFY